MIEIAKRLPVSWNQKIRPTIVNKVPASDFIGLLLDPGAPTIANWWSPLETWADGSTYSPNTGYTWPKTPFGSGHSQPQNPSLTYNQLYSWPNNSINLPPGGPGGAGWSWGKNLYAYFSRGANVSGAQNGVALDRTLQFYAFISPLGWDPEAVSPVVLGTCTSTFFEHDTYPAQSSQTPLSNFDANNYSVYSPAIPFPAFNGVRAGVVCSTPLYSGGPPNFTSTAPPQGGFNAISAVCVLQAAIYSSVLDVTGGYI